MKASAYQKEKEAPLSLDFLCVIVWKSEETFSYPLQGRGEKDQRKRA